MIQQRAINAAVGVRYERVFCFKYLDCTPGRPSDINSNSGTTNPVGCQYLAKQDRIKMAGKRKFDEMRSSQSNTKPRKLSSQLHTKVPGSIVPKTVKTLNQLTSVAGITSINESQGKDRIHVTVAEYSEEYLQYLDKSQNDPPITDKSVLRLQTFGPVEVDDSEAMKQFVIHMTAIMLFIKRSCAGQ